MSTEEIRPAPPLSIVALDDDPDFREYLVAALESLETTPGDGSADANHRVRAAATPDEFFRLCEERLPDVVLLDMKMGAHDGREVLAQIRQRWTHLCVIVVTGYPSMDTMRETFKQDVFDYLAKPFGAADLAGVLAQAARELDLGKRPQDRLRESLGRQIRLARAERAWTLKDLSQASGISVSQISSIERGTHLPSLESLLALAEALTQKPSAWLAGAEL